MSKRTSSDSGLAEVADSITKKPTLPTGNDISPSAGESQISAAGNDVNNNIKLVVGVASLKGQREEMQDRHIIDTAFDRRPQITPIHNIHRCVLFGLFDGHAGTAASEFCEKVFPDRLASFCKLQTQPMNEVLVLQKSMKRVFYRTFRQVDADFLDTARACKPPLKDGTTATLVFIINDVVFAANVGDSRALICRKSETGAYVPLLLTVDHSPMDFEERTRIQQAGGFVKDGRVQGIIEVSRSIGDFSFKNFGVSSVPDAKKITLTSADLFGILACDGVWKVFSSQQAIDFVLEDIKKLTAASKTKLIDASVWKSAAANLAAEAVRRGCGDNVSAVLFGFEDNLGRLV